MYALTYHTIALILGIFVWLRWNVHNKYKITHIKMIPNTSYRSIFAVYWPILRLGPYNRLN